MSNKKKNILLTNEIRQKHQIFFFIVLTHLGVTFLTLQRSSHLLEVMKYFYNLKTCGGKKKGGGNNGSRTNEGVSIGKKDLAEKINKPYYI